MPVHQYLIRTRLGKALAAMRADEADLTDIALATGFANHSHFTSSFRSFFGITPSRLLDYAAACAAISRSAIHALAERDVAA